MYLRNSDPACENHVCSDPESGCQFYDRGECADENRNPYSSDPPFLNEYEKLESKPIKYQRGFHGYMYSRYSSKYNSQPWDSQKFCRNRQAQYCYSCNVVVSPGDGYAFAPKNPGLWLVTCRGVACMPFHVKEILHEYRLKKHKMTNTY